MGKAAGHLTDHFHLLSVVKGCLSLLTIGNFLMELLVGLFELPSSGLNKHLQLCSGSLTV